MGIEKIIAKSINARHKKASTDEKNLADRVKVYNEDKTKPWGVGTKRPGSLNGGK